MRETEQGEQLEDRLAEFTDRVLAGKSAQIESGAEDELRRLEETILRLKHAIPHTTLDEATIVQMQSSLTARLRAEAEGRKVDFWWKWLAPRPPRPQLALALGTAIILLFAIFIAPQLTEAEPSISAVATRPSPFTLFLALLAGVALAVIWLSRRK